ncbi:MAG TPA: hypothetical protein DCG87_02575 [Synergistaceae bacterium]|nr:hypothetical protein [Synergistaceae bacterium]
MVMVVFATFAVMLMSRGKAYAHCDTLDGPVVTTARSALETGDITPLLKWVSPEEEETIKASFERALSVRKLGVQARELADMYFFETLVRVHRAGEGAPYTGLKPGSDVDPAVALADEAIEIGSVDKLANVLTQALDKGLRERYEKVMERRRYVDESVEAGREYVEAYVDFTHFAEGIHEQRRRPANYRTYS